MRLPFLIVAFVHAQLVVAATTQDARFDSDGVAIHFVMAGQGSPVVLLHGFGGSADGAWVKPGTFDAMVDAGFRVIAMDHRGHGQSDKPHGAETYGRNMAEDVRRLLDHLDISQAHIVGYSMGAKIANTFRTAHPNRLLSLTLGGYGWPWRSSEVSLDEARAAMASRSVLPGNDLDALAAYQVLANDLVPAEVYLRLNQVPTLSIVGSADEAVSREDVEMLRETMFGVTAVDMPGTHAGEDGALYKPQFAQEIIRFMQQHDTQQRQK